MLAGASAPLASSAKVAAAAANCLARSWAKPSKSFAARSFLPLLVASSTLGSTSFSRASCWPASSLLRTSSSAWSKLFPLAVDLHLLKLASRGRVVRVDLEDSGVDLLCLLAQIVLDGPLGGLEELVGVFVLDLGELLGQFHLGRVGDVDPGDLELGEGEAAVGHHDGYRVLLGRHGAGEGPAVGEGQLVGQGRAKPSGQESTQDERRAVHTDS